MRLTKPKEMTPLMKQHFAQMSVRKRKQKYYYHCKVDSPSGNAMTELIAKCDEASRKVEEWVKSHGGVSWIESGIAMAGGCDAVIFDKRPNSALWAYLHNDDEEKNFDAEQLAQGAGIYLPNVSDTFSLKPYLKGEQTAAPGTPEALAVEMVKLPCVSPLNLYEILQPEQRTVTTPDGKKKVLPLTMRETPRFFQQNGWWYVEVPMLINGEGFQQIAKSTFELRMRQALREETRNQEK